jgi:hypothetical protein
MKKIGILLVVLVAVMALATTALAQSAYNTSFTTSITYQNVGAGQADIMFTFYPESDGTGIEVSRTLPQDAGGSLYVGSLDEISDGFNGSVVMSSNEPVVATMVQVPQGNPNVKNRPLSNGFSSGASEYLLATVLKNQFNTTSRFSVQNASTGPVDLTIELYDASSPTDPPIEATYNNLPAGAAQYFDAGMMPEITASSFNGSAVITAVESGTSTPAPIVASVVELSTNAGGASSFEGVTGGSMTVYMPSALCEQFGASSAYAVQNTSDSEVGVTVTYSSGETDTADIASGAKNSFITCDVNDPGYSGSATITADGNIVVIGKVFGSGNSTAFVGATSGSSMLALPYVRFTTSEWDSGNRQRAYIAIQNVGSALADGDVVLRYLDINGDEVGTHTLGAMATGEKLNSWATHPDVVGDDAVLSEFGYAGGQFGGSVIIEGPSGSELVAVVRIQSKFGAGVVGEDYNGIAINP